MPEDTRMCYFCQQDKENVKWSASQGGYSCWDCMLKLKADYEGVKRIVKTLKEGLDK